MEDAFGPLTRYEQINRITKMFAEDNLFYYRPIIGKLLNTFGYDVTYEVFSHIYKDRIEPKNLWAYAFAAAQKITNKNNDKKNRNEINQNTKNTDIETKEKVDRYYLEGKITFEDYTSINSIKEAKALLERIGSFE